MFTRRFWSCAVLALAILTVGCTDVRRENGVAVFTVAWWALLGIVLAALALIAGVVLFHARLRRGGPVVLSLVALFLLGVTVPSTSLEEVKVDAQHFEITAGTWFQPTHSYTRFASLREIRLMRVGKTQRIICIGKDGRETDLPWSIPFDGALDDIRAQAREHGVAVRDQR